MSRLVVVSNRVALPHENEPRRRPGGGDARRAGRARRHVVRLERPARARRIRREAASSSDGNIDLLHDRPVVARTSRPTTTASPTARCGRCCISAWTWSTTAARPGTATGASTRCSPTGSRQQLRDDDIIWVHDYHLIPLAQRLRERGVGNRIGFFLHVPMPSSDLLAALPAHREVFAALSSYDLVGFQTARDLERFQDYVRLFGGGRVDRPGPAGDRRRAPLPRRRIPDQHRHRHDRAAGGGGACASRAVQKLRDEPDRAPARDRRRPAGLFQGPARTLPRLRAPPRPPSGAARATDVPADRAASRGEVPRIPVAAARTRRRVRPHQRPARAPDWTPLRYVNRNFAHDVLTGFYRIADIGVVTPLRDGMNLVAKEFVAAQDPDDPGVLVLSRFAGAASELTRSAAGESLRPGRRRRCDRAGLHDAAGRTQGALAGDDGYAAAARHRSVAAQLPRRAGGGVNDGPACWTSPRLKPLLRSAVPMRC